MSAGIIDDSLVPAPQTNQGFEQLVKEDEELEYFECQRCGEINIVKVTPKARRRTKMKHVKVDDVTWASLKRYASINNTSINYALLLLLHTARTANVNYLINDKNLVKSRFKKQPNA